MTPSAPPTLADRAAAAFAAYRDVLFAFGLMSLLYSGGPLSEGVRAGKRYFQFFGVLFILAAVPFPPALVKRWWAFLIAVAVLQLPLALYQRIVLVPSLEGKPNVFPLDIVVGTMEGSLSGGGSSGVMALLLVFVLSYLVAAYREGIIPIHRFLLLGLAVTLPLSLGEVTLIVVLIPLALATVGSDLLKRRPFAFLVGSGLAVAFAALLGWAYLAINQQPGQSLANTVEGIVAYNFGDKPYFGQGLNRTSVYAYWLNNQSISDPVSILFGHGLGSSFGDLNDHDPGHMDLAHARMYIGLTAASSLLWDLGLVGLALFLGLLLSAVRHAAKLVRLAEPGFDRAFCRALHAMTLMLCLMLFYSSSLISVPSLEVLMAIDIGLIAWRWRRLDRASGTSDSPGRA